jgi:NAD(P)-dependent dehydrogenase (short-subunit alcohol dehydrogenase family)
MSPNLAGKVAVVTGAGRGIGRAEALALAAAGARVIVNDLGGNWNGAGEDKSAADAVVAEIRSKGGESIANYGDVASMEAGKQIVQQALDAYGRLDILVNNAGILCPKPFIESSEAEWDRMIAVHLKGHFTVTRAALPVFITQRSGRIVNTSSEAGLGMPLFSSYGTAKEGITGFTRSLALEMAPHRVTVNQIRPRSSDTRMYSVSTKAGEAMGAELTKTLTGATDQGLFSRPKEFPSDRVASFVIFLCSDEANEISGGDFIVGGGQVTPLSQMKPIATVDWLAADNVARLKTIVLGAKCAN